MEALENGDVAAFAASIAEGAVFVDSSVQAAKAQVVNNVEGFRPRDFTFTAIRFVAFG